jgi:hypothetical protein
MYYLCNKTDLGQINVPLSSIVKTGTDVFLNTTPSAIKEEKLPETSDIIPKLKIVGLISGSVLGLYLFGKITKKILFWGLTGAGIYYLVKR